MTPDTHAALDARQLGRIGAAWFAHGASDAVSGHWSPPEGDPLHEPRPAVRLANEAVHRLMVMAYGQGHQSAVKKA